MQDAEQVPGAPEVDAAREHILRQILHRVGCVGLRRPTLGDVQLRSTGTYCILFHVRQKGFDIGGVQICVLRLPKYWPPPSPPGECVLPPQQRRGVHTRRAERGVGGSIFWKTQDIGLVSYSNNLSTMYVRIHDHTRYTGEGAQVPRLCIVSFDAESHGWAYRILLWNMYSYGAHIQYSSNRTPVFSHIGVTFA